MKDFFFEREENVEGKGRNPDFAYLPLSLRCRCFMGHEN